MNRKAATTPVVFTVATDPSAPPLDESGLVRSIAALIRAHHKATTYAGRRNAASDHPKVTTGADDAHAGQNQGDQG